MPPRGSRASSALPEPPSAQRGNAPPAAKKSKSNKRKSPDPDPDAGPYGNTEMHQRKKGKKPSPLDEHQCGIKESEFEPATSTEKIINGQPAKPKTFRGKTVEDMKKYIPTRLEFTFPHPPPGKDRSDEWFGLLINEIYGRAMDFAQQQTIANPKGAQVPERWDPVDKDKPETSPWFKLNLDKDFLALVDKVARGDPDYDGWHRLITDNRERSLTIMGVIAEVLNLSVFDDLLFGATDKKKDTMMQEDDEFLHEDGYHRKAKRAESVRRSMGDDILTPNFWQRVDWVTHKLFCMLFPLLSNTEKDPKEKDAQLSNPLTLNYQHLYDVVALAGYTAICMARSNSIFRIEFSRPGDLVNLEQEHGDSTVYEFAKMKSARVDHKVMMEEAVKAGEAPRSAIPEDEDEAKLTALEETHEKDRQYWLAEKDELPKDKKKKDAEMEKYWKFHPNMTKGYRVAKVKIVTWPNIRRYKPLGIAKEGELTAPDGDRISTITKSKVVYYAGRTHRETDDKERETLAEFMEPYKKKGV